jgi:hypothetical protein
MFASAQTALLDLQVHQSMDSCDNVHHQTIEDFQHANAGLALHSSIPITKATYDLLSTYSGGVLVNTLVIQEVRVKERDLLVRLRMDFHRCPMGEWLVLVGVRLRVYLDVSIHASRKIILAHLRHDHSMFFVGSLDEPRTCVSNISSVGSPGPDQS